MTVLPNRIWKKDLWHDFTQDSNLHTKQINNRDMPRNAFHTSWQSIIHRFGVRKIMSWIITKKSASNQASLNLFSSALTANLDKSSHAAKPVSLISIGMMIMKRYYTVADHENQSIKRWEHEGGISFKSSFEVPVSHVASFHPEDWQLLRKSHENRLKSCFSLFHSFVLCFFQWRMRHWFLGNIKEHFFKRYISLYCQDVTETFRGIIIALRFHYKCSHRRSNRNISQMEKEP